MEILVISFIVSESLEKTFMTFFLAVVLTLLPELFYQLLRIFNYPLGYNLCSTLRDIAGRIQNVSLIDI